MCGVGIQMSGFSCDFSCGCQVRGMKEGVNGARCEEKRELCPALGVRREV